MANKHKKTIILFTSFLIFLAGYSQTKKEQILELSASIDSLNLLISSQNNKYDSLILIINKNKIEALENSKKLSEIEMKNKELNETFKTLNSKFSQLYLLTDNEKTIEVNKKNYNLNFPCIEDTSIVFKLNSEDYELKILRKTVDRTNTRLDVNDETSMNYYNDMIVCILKNGEIKYLLESGFTFFDQLKYLSNGKVLLYFVNASGGPGVQTTVYSISQNENKIEDNYVFTITEMDRELLSKDTRQIIVFTADQVGDARVPESHFDPHKYIIGLYSLVNEKYEYSIIGTTKNRYDLEFFDAYNALLLLKQKEPNLFINFDLSKFL